MLCVPFPRFQKSLSKFIMEATVCSDKTNKSEASLRLDRAWSGCPEIKGKGGLLAHHFKHGAMQISYQFSSRPDLSRIFGTTASFTIACLESSFYLQPGGVARQRAGVL